VGGSAGRDGRLIMPQNHSCSCSRAS
jgi:hypothetical protein